MSEKKKFRGPWGQKFFIVVLGVVLGILFYWLLGFITRDIGTLKGPDYAPVRAKHVDAQLVDEQRGLQEGLAETKRNIRDQQEQQRILRDTTTSLQNSIILDGSLQFGNSSRLLHPKMKKSSSSFISWLSFSSSSSFVLGNPMPNQPGFIPALRIATCW